MNDNINQQVKQEPQLDKKSKATTWIICSVLTILLLVWFAPPLAAEMYLSKNIDKFISADTTNDVNLKANTFQLLAGKFKSFSISGSNLKVGNLLVQSYDLEATEGQIDVFKTLKERDIVLKESPVITLNMKIAVGDMSRLLQSFYGSLSDVTIIGRDGYLDVSGISATKSGLNLPVQFKLNITNKDWSSLQVTPYDMQVLTDKDIENEVIDELTKMYTKTILFNSTTPPIYINNVVVNETEILITSNSALN